MIDYEKSTCIYCKCIKPGLPLARVKEFAEAHQVTKRTIQRWLRDGKIRSFKIPWPKTGGYFHLIPPCDSQSK